MKHQNRWFSKTYKKIAAILKNLWKSSHQTVSVFDSKAGSFLFDQAATGNLTSVQVSGEKPPMENNNGFFFSLIFQISHTSCHWQTLTWSYTEEGIHRKLVPDFRSATQDQLDTSVIECCIGNWQSCIFWLVSNFSVIRINAKRQWNNSYIVLNAVHKFNQTYYSNTSR